MNEDTLRLLAIIYLSVLAFVVVIGGLLLLVAYRQVKNMDVPEDAGFSETLLYAPFTIVVAIDLLDLGLDFFSAPISWIVLDRLGLKSLREVAAIEAIIPGTQLLPTLTLCWLGVRLLGRRRTRASIPTSTRDR